MLEVENKFVDLCSLETLFNDNSIHGNEQCSSTGFVPCKARILVTCIDYKNNQIIGRFLNSEERYVELEEKINNFYENPSLRKAIDNIKKGTLYAAKIDGKWCRVQLMLIHRILKTCSVLMIDIGRVILLPLAALYVLDKWFISDLFAERYAVRFITPMKCWPGFSEVGFLDGSDISESDDLDAYILSSNEPYITLFKKETNLTSKEKSFVAPACYPVKVNRFQQKENNFSRSLMPSIFSNFGLSEDIRFNSSFLKKQFCRNYNNLNLLKSTVNAGKNSKMDEPLRILPLKNRLSQSKMLRTKNSCVEIKESHDSFCESRTKCETEAKSGDCTASLQHQRSEEKFVARVINVNSVCKIYLETPETKRRMDLLRQQLDSLNVNELEQIDPLCLNKDDVMLYFSNDGGRCRARVFCKGDDELFLICTDNGEEIYVNLKTSKNNKFYRLPLKLSLDNFEAACLGPLRLSGKPSKMWMTLDSSTKLRELCKTAISACFDIDNNTCITLFDKRGRSINHLFDAYLSTALVIKQTSLENDDQESNTSEASFV